MGIIIKRGYDLKRFRSLGSWVIIYGRRKTGKTFFVKKFLKWDEYYLVTRDGRIFDENFNEVSYEVLKDRMKREKERLFVIDEFHRLPNDFLDFLQMLDERMKIILVTSTLWRAKEKLKGNPTLGLFDHFRMGLIDERDMLMELSGRIKEARELVEACVYLREPILIRRYKGNVGNLITNFLFENKDIIERLIWEIFSEEEKELTSRYLVVLEAIASGKNESGEIASELSKIFGERVNASYVQKYLKDLTEMGIIEKIKIYGKKRAKFYHVSPLLDLHFYLNAKYGYAERDVPKEFIASVVKEKIPLHVEHFFRNLLSKIFNLIPEKVVGPDLEIDIALLKFKEIEVVAEVKWTKFISKKEILKIEEKLENFKRSFLIVPDEKCLEYMPEKVEVLDIKRIIELLKEKRK